MVLFYGFSSKSDYMESKKELNGQSEKDKKLNEDMDLNAVPHNLAYNEEEDSFELDVESDDLEYQHPDPYDTSVKNGGDANSDYDTANPTVREEYDKALSFESEVDKLSMHIDHGEIVKLNATDKELSHTKEDERDDLDEEGYPKNIGI